MTGMARLLARCPWLGCILWRHAGLLTYWLDARYARRLRENLKTSGIAADPAAYRRLLRRAIASNGQAFCEILVIWFRPSCGAAIGARVQGWEHVEAARAAGRGLILLTPHLGCFEIAGLYSGSRFPFTELYRPPKVAWLESWMHQGRARGHIELATTDYAGVKKLLAALKRGEAIGALPDQVPSQGDGAWADFFGRPAYTMTLMSRLQRKTGAAIIFFTPNVCRAGADIWCVICALAALSENPEQGAREINAALEAAIRDCPEQYLWSYNAIKVRRRDLPGHLYLLAAAFFALPLLALVGQGLGMLFYAWGATAQGGAHEFAFMFSRTGRCGARAHVAATFSRLRPQHRGARHLLVVARGAHSALVPRGRSGTYASAARQTGDHAGAAFRRADIGGSRVALDFHAASMYSKQKNPVLDRLLLHGGNASMSPICFRARTMCARW